MARIARALCVALVASVAMLAGSSRGATLTLVQSTNAVLNARMVTFRTGSMETINFEPVNLDSAVRGSLTIGPFYDSGETAQFRLALDFVEGPLVYTATFWDEWQGWVDVSIQLDDYLWSSPGTSADVYMIRPIPDGFLPQVGDGALNGQQQVGSYTTDFESSNFSQQFTPLAPYNGATPSRVVLGAGQLPEDTGGVYLSGDAIYFITQVTFDQLVFVPEPVLGVLLLVMLAVSTGSRCVLRQGIRPARFSEGEVSAAGRATSVRLS